MSALNKVNYTLLSMLRRSTVRSFRTSSQRRSEVTPIPPRRPVGAFRGGIFGFLMGSSLAGAGISYYLLEEYTLSNGLLTQDIYALQTSLHRVHDHLESVERRIFELEKNMK